MNSQELRDKLNQEIERLCKEAEQELKDMKTKEVREVAKA